MPRLRRRLCPFRVHSARSHPAHSQKGRCQPAHSQIARSQPTHCQQAQARHRHRHQAKALRRQLRARRVHRQGCAAAAPGSRAAAWAVGVLGAESRPGRLPRNRPESATAEAAARSPRRRSPVPLAWVGAEVPRVARTPLRGQTGLGHRATPASRAAVGRCCPARRGDSSARLSRHSTRRSRHSPLRSHRSRRQSGRCQRRRSDRVDRRRYRRLSLCPDRPSPPRPRAVISLLASAGAAIIS